jgi:hypothetical protein
MLSRPEGALFAFALALRCAHLWIFNGDFWFETPLLDDNIFVSWADVIEKEGPLARSLGAFDFNPAYPYLLVLLRALSIGMGTAGVYLIQHVAGAFVPVLLYKATERAFDRSTAFVAGALAALYGPAFFYESRFLGECWIFFFNALCLRALIRGDRKPAILPWAVAGLALGFSNLFRPNVMVFLPFALAWLAWSFGVHEAADAPDLPTRPGRIKAAVAASAVFLLCFWLPLLPFQLRNRAVVEGAGWGLTTASGGVNLYLGNNPEADGLNQAPSFIRYGPGHEYQDFKEEAERRTGTSLTKREVSSYWTAQTLEWFKTRPGPAFSLLLRKAGFFWNHREPPDNFFLSLFERFTRLGSWPLVAWGLIAPLGLAGFFWSLALGNGRRFWILHAYVLCYFGVNVLFYILSRYRFPAAVGLIPFAAFALVEARRAIAARSAFKTLGLGILAAACLLFSRLELIGEEDKAVSHYSMAVIYANQGWRDKAVLEYRKSIEANPRFKPSYVNLGILEGNRGNYRESLAALEGALPLESDPEQRRALISNIEALRRRVAATSKP